MGKVHDVQQGEHVAAIAAANGFGEASVVWDHPDNADLKQKRVNPCVLMPGDKLAIPDKKPRQDALATGKMHPFVVKRPKIKLLIVLRDAANKPLGGTPCKLECGGRTFSLTSDGDGKVEQEIPLDAQEGKLTFNGQTRPILIGHLDPLDAPSGWRARLNNLGYAAGTSDDPQDPALRSAIEEFQCDNAIPVTGNCDAATQSKLKEAHGC